jgi:L-ascorbate metabolism protein UlaG (beta-lactamase superfamily)
MEISKHVHSCLLVKEKDKTVLIDPGNYTFEERALDLSKISNLDFILITHEHQDHMEIPFIKQILEKFPKVKIITTPSASKILKSEGIKSFSEGNEFISVSKAPHELLLGRKSPENFLFNVSGKLTHPGDSLRFKKTCEILALPIQAPWGSMWLRRWKKQ